jgi:AcrR family transcriptional regulator
MHVKSKAREAGAEPEGERTRDEQMPAVQAAQPLSDAPRSRKAEQSLQTRAALTAAARALFAQRGYADVSTEEIVRAAGVTRGALYHHFAGKRELFEAVYEELERELVEEVAKAAELQTSDPLDVLRLGAQAFRDASEDPAVQRIALLDAPAVLGWARWREIGMRYGLGVVQAVLQAAVDAHVIDDQPVEPLAHMLLGAIDEGAMLVARAEDGGKTRASVGASVERFIDALRSRSGV